MPTYLLWRKGMATDTFLSQEEIEELTDRRLRHAQVRVLRAMGIEHKVRPNGSVAILRAHIIKVFDGESQNQRKINECTPNWDGI